MKDPRTIVVKALFNADEFLALSEECKTADVPQSRLLRDLAKSWLAERKDNRAQQLKERPPFGQNLAMLLPGRTNYGVRVSLRMRL